jgi:hypothetical protein
MTSIAIVALICWAIVELVNGPKSKKKDKKDTVQFSQTQDLERKVEMMRERIETL